MIELDKVETCLQPVPAHTSPFRIQILQLLDEHERLEMEHDRLQHVLQHLIRTGLVTDPDVHSLAHARYDCHDVSLSPVPYERFDGDLSPRIACAARDHPQDVLGKSDCTPVVGAVTEAISVNQVLLCQDAQGAVGNSLAEAEKDGATLPHAAEPQDDDLNVKTPQQQRQQQGGLWEASVASSQSWLKSSSSIDIDRMKFRVNSQRSWFRRSIAKLVTSHYFEALVFTVIMANVIYVAVKIEHGAHHVDEVVGRRVTSLIFCMIFCLELCLRILTYGRSFFFGPERGWNLFDLGCVIQSVCEEVGTLAHFVGGPISFLRAFRVCKVLKVLRVVRAMKSLREMRLILLSIMGSITCMFWSLLFIGTVKFMFSMVFVQACSDYLWLTDQDDVNPKLKQQLLQYFPSVSGGMASLFLAVSGGVDWEVIASPLNDVGRMYYIVFCFYISFHQIVVVNTITALFVEASFSTSILVHQTSIQDVYEKRHEYIERLKMMFNETDADDDGTIDKEEFCAKLNDPNMSAFAESLGIEISDARLFFDLITEGDESSSIDLESFVLSCIKMRGQATSLDMQDMLIKQRKYQSEIRENHEFLRDQIQLLVEKQAGL